MKKILIVAVAALVSLTGFAQPKFAHVNLAELVQLMPESDAAREQMAASQKEAQETFQAMYEEYQSKAQKYQQNAATWNQTIKESKEKELTDIQQRLSEFEQSIQEELQQQQQTLMAPIQQKATDVVTKLAKEGGYVYVVPMGAMVYIDTKQSTDLTPAARKALNIPDDRTLESLYQEMQAKAQAEQQAQ